MLTSYWLKWQFSHVPYICLLQTLNSPQLEIKSDDILSGRTEDHPVCTRIKTGRVLCMYECDDIKLTFICMLWHMMVIIDCLSHISMFCGFGQQYYIVNHIRHHNFNVHRSMPRQWSRDFWRGMARYILVVHGRFIHIFWKGFENVYSSNEAVAGQFTISYMATSIIMTHFINKSPSWYDIAR